MMSVKITGLDATIKKFNKEYKGELELSKKAYINLLMFQVALNTPVDTGRAQEGWYTKDDEIRNDVPYISALNEGHSTQAPANYVEATLLSNPGVKPNGMIVRYRETE